MTGSFRVPEAGSVDSDNPILPCELINETADQKVLGHRPVSMQQDHRPPLPARDVVDGQAVHLDKAPRRRTYLLGLEGLHRLAGLSSSLAAFLYRDASGFGCGPQQLGEIGGKEPRDAPRASPFHVGEQGEPRMAAAPPARTER